MDKKYIAFICECGNASFWWFLDYLRCPECYMEFKKTGVRKKEYWQRRFNKEKKCYDKNWEKINIFIIV